MNPRIAESFHVLDPERIRRLNELLGQVESLAIADREQERYGEAAQATEPALCCPVDYDSRELGHIPQRILAVDYGCGDPTLFAEEGMTVLDLGSGSGKHAFMIARRVGPEGRVIGVDKTREMLALARGAVGEVTEALGYEEPNVEFRHGDIENLQVDKDRLCTWLADHEISSYDGLAALEAHLGESPLVATGSVDLVVSNCVLNLVDDRHKARLLKELYRVVKRGGSVAISDIVSDRDIPSELKDDPVLWTGCLSGAFRRDRFMEAFAEAGFHGMSEVKSYFWKRIGDINFFSVTVRAYKGKQGPCYETYRSAMYRGPFSSVMDDDHHTYDRGTFVPVCEKTANLLEQAPYRAQFHVTPALEDPGKKLPFDCGDGAMDRGLTEAQHQALNDSIDSGSCCEPDAGGCC